MSDTDRKLNIPEGVSEVAKIEARRVFDAVEGNVTLRPARGAHETPDIAVYWDEREPVAPVGED